MLQTLLPRELGSVALGALLSCCLLPLALQAQTTCPCPNPQPFGSCVSKTTNYPNQYPGSALVVETEAGRYLYVADLFNGFSYRYDATRFETQGANNPLRFASPRGSNATTGMAHRKTENGDFLYWAIEAEIWRSDLLGGNPFRTGTVQLSELARLLRDETGDATISTGSLGGIAYHAGRGTFWGVDIINDVYFEFAETGDLVLSEGKPRFFFNPRRDPRVGGAYGNSITYVATPAGDFFDIPIGSLADRRPSEVWRVHASDGEAPETTRIGDSTGVFYQLGASLGSPKFVTGIAFWPNSCTDGQDSEFLLNLDTIGGTPKILQVSVDPPSSASIADFRCERTGGDTVRLTWRKTLPYTSLAITRREITLNGSNAVTIFENDDFGTDPQEFEDTGVPDGSFEYAAAVTAADPLPDVICRLTVGNGALLAHRRFRPAEVADPLPYAITVAGGETVIVVDLNAGVASTFDLDLNPLGELEGPFDSGLTTGVAYGLFEATGGQDEERLYWLQNLGGQHFLRATNLLGQPLFPAVRVPGPTNLRKGIQLGDITYDSTRNVFWTVDLLNKALYAITPDGAIADIFLTSQIAAPRVGGFRSGGIAMARSSDSNVTLDLPVGPQAAGFVTQIGRFEYDVSDTTAPPIELYAIDLQAATGAADIGGVAIVKDGNEGLQFVVAMDTRAVYKLRITGPDRGGVLFRRGDVNNDDLLNISDPSFLLEHLFRQGVAPPCPAAADADRSGALDVTDAIFLFNYLFRGGPAPANPFTRCGIDATTTLACPAALCTNA